jgi:hypothetical protein
MSLTINVAGNINCGETWRTTVQPPSTILTLIGQSLILFPTTTNAHDLPRTVVLDPVLDQVNCVGVRASAVRACGRTRAGSLHFDFASRRSN